MYERTIQLNRDKLPSFVRRLLKGDRIRQEPGREIWHLEALGSSGQVSHVYYEGSSRALVLRDDCETNIKLIIVAVGDPAGITPILYQPLISIFPDLGETSNTQLRAFSVEFGIDMEILEELRQVLAAFKPIGA